MKLSSSRRPRSLLKLQILEDRNVPATAVYAAASQTLSVTGANNDVLTVDATAADPTGYLTVKAGTTVVFDSSAGARPVRNLVVRFNGVDTGNLTINTGVRLAGNLNVLGAKVSQEMTSRATVGGNLTFTGAGTAATTLNLSSTTQVGGNVNLRMGAGTNSAYVNGTFAGNFTFAGSAGFDNFEFDQGTIGKTLSVALGNSPPGYQYVSIGYSTAGVSVYGSLKVTSGATSDNIALKRLYVANALSVFTGGDIDVVEIDDANIFGPTLIDLGAGNDQLKLEQNSSDGIGSLSSATTFGGTFRVRGGSDNDSVNLSNDTDATTLIRFGSRVVLQGGAGMDNLGNAGNEFKITGNFEDFETGNSLP